MADGDLAELVAGKSESLDVEYKAWMETGPPEARAKLAKHIAALANHGGGYLVFGVDDTTRTPMGQTTLDRANFSQARLAEIAERYLDPPPHLDVDEATYEAVAYPVATVQSHGARPVVARRDGPTVDRATVGIRQGDVYVRAPGPKSVRARTADDWGPLFERCLAHRSDLLAKMMRQAIARPGKPSPSTRDGLVAKVEIVSADFSAQSRSLAAEAPDADKARVLMAATAHCCLGYALVDGAGEAIELGSLRALVGRAAVGMRQVAQSRDEWTSFLPLTAASRAPQMRATTAASGEIVDQYLEGMRLPSLAVVHPVLDYWRVYKSGVAVTAQSYREDHIGELLREAGYLTVAQTLFRLHSVLAHARFVAVETPGVEQVVMRMDWRGLAGRPLLQSPREGSLARPMAADQFVKTLTMAWAELRDRYFDALLGVAMPFFDAFPYEGWPPPQQWLTREFAEAELRRSNATVRFDE